MKFTQIIIPSFVFLVGLLVGWKFLPSSESGEQNSTGESTGEQNSIGESTGEQNSIGELIEGPIFQIYVKVEPLSSTSAELHAKFVDLDNDTIYQSFIIIITKEVIERAWTQIGETTLINDKLQFQYDDIEYIFEVDTNTMTAINN